MSSLSKSKSASKKRGSKQSPKKALFMSDDELANLGDGEVAYIKVMSSAQAKQMFPSIQGLPKNGTLYSLHAADGEPIALTDTIQAAVGHAMEDELAIASVH